MKHDVVQNYRGTANGEFEYWEHIMRKFHAIRRLLGCILIKRIPFQHEKFPSPVFSGWTNYMSRRGAFELLVSELSSSYSFIF